MSSTVSNLIATTTNDGAAGAEQARALRSVKPAIVSCVVPPSMTGQANMLQRLLGGLSGEDYRMISADHDRQFARSDFDLHRLAAPHFALPVSQSTRHRAARLLPRVVFAGYDGAKKVLARARRIHEVVRDERCGAVICCTGDVHDLPAGFLAARWARVPFYAYTFDFYSFQANLSFLTAHRVLSRLERFILTRSAGVIVPNEFLREEYRRRYGVNATIVRNSIDATPAESNFPPSENTATELDGPTPRDVRLVYTGSVYEAQFDAFRNLLAALAKIGKPEVRLHLYTEQSPAEIARGRLVGPYDHHPPVSPDAALELQRSADILFLPLAFDSPYPEIIKTSAPSKLGEYLASGRPILAHAPADSFLAWYFKQHECGVIVDRADPELLRLAVERLLNDSELRRSVVRNARACAAEFHVATARSTFVNLLNTTRTSLAA